MEIVGDLAAHLADDLRRFAESAATHPWGGSIQGRLVIAKPQPGGLRPTIARALAQWMPPGDFASWQAQQQGRPVTTAAKTFIADDDVVTAVVAPSPASDALFLGWTTHEMLEMAAMERASREGPVSPHTTAEANGIVLVDEYTHERTRLTIATGLQLPPSPIDTEPGLISQTADLVGALASMSEEGHPLAPITVSSPHLITGIPHPAA